MSGNKRVKVSERERGSVRVFKRECERSWAAGRVKTSEAECRRRSDACLLLVLVSVAPLVLHLHHHLLQLLLCAADDLVGRPSLPAGFMVGSVKHSPLHSHRVSHVWNMWLDFYLVKVYLTGRLLSFQSITDEDASSNRAAGNVGVERSFRTHVILYQIFFCEFQKLAETQTSLVSHVLCFLLQLLLQLQDFGLQGGDGRLELGLDGSLQLCQLGFQILHFKQEF